MKHSKNTPPTRKPTLTVENIYKAIERLSLQEIEELKHEIDGLNIRNTHPTRKLTLTTVKEIGKAIEGLSLQELEELNQMNQRNRCLSRHINIDPYYVDRLNDPTRSAIAALPKAIRERLHGLVDDLDYTLSDVDLDDPVSAKITVAADLLIDALFDRRGEPSEKHKAPHPEITL